MGRKSVVETGDILAAVGAEVAGTGRFTLQQLTAATGVSTGSVYHRFASREALLAETWLRALQTFQTAFLDALDAGAEDPVERAALATPRFCRKEPDAARVLACCREAEFVGPATPTAMANAIRAANARTQVGLQRFARAIGRPLLSCRLAFVAYPLAAVRLYLPDRPVPMSIDAEVLKAARAALA